MMQCQCCRTEVIAGTTPVIVDTKHPNEVYCLGHAYLFGCPACLSRMLVCHKSGCQRMQPMNDEAKALVSAVIIAEEQYIVFT